MSKSMPAQNALPAPVIIATRAWLFSMASRAVCNSAIMGTEIALRFSGRFSVMVARLPAISRRSVEYIFGNTSSVHKRGMRIFHADLIGHFEYLRQLRGIDARISARFSEGGKNIFRRDVADQIVSCKGAAAKPGQCAIKSPASRFVRCENLFFCMLRAAVQVYAQLDSRDMILHAAIQIADESRRRISHSIRERNCAHANILQPLQSIRHNFRPPRLIVRIPKRHRNINDQVAFRSCRFFPQLFNERARFIARHIGIGPPKISRNRIGISNCSHARSRESSLQSLFIHHDADNFWSFDTSGKGSSEFRHHRFGIRHLLHMLRRNKTHRINALESRKYKFFQILRLILCWDLFRQSLPSIPRALNYLDRFHTPLLSQTMQSTTEKQIPMRLNIQGTQAVFITMGTGSKWIPGGTLARVQNMRIAHKNRETIKVMGPRFLIRFAELRF